MGTRSLSQSDNEMKPLDAMNEWKGSSDHYNTILQKGDFSIATWRAMGVGIEGNCAFVWFGMDVDPAGQVPGQSEQESAFSGLTLEPKKLDCSRGETVQFVLKKSTPGSVDLEGAHYQIEKSVNGNWVNYYKSDSDSWRFKTPVIEYGGEAKIINWDQRQKGYPNNKASTGPYRMKFYVPRAFDSFMTAEFNIV